MNSLPRILSLFIESHVISNLGTNKRAEWPILFLLYNKREISLKRQNNVLDFQDDNFMPFVCSVMNVNSKIIFTIISRF